MFQNPRQYMSRWYVTMIPTARSGVGFGGTGAFRAVILWASAVSPIGLQGSLR